MCGRLTLFAPPDELERIFSLAAVPALEPRYNIAPSQQIAAVRLPPEGGPRELVFLKWGLVPGWAGDPLIGNQLINARSETAAEKPSFSEAFHSRRCLIPASGFYEWQRTHWGKQPFFVRLRNEEPLAIAGLWESWEREGTELIETCTILTTEANSAMHPIHDRMPVIVEPSDFALWLDSDPANTPTRANLLRPLSSEKMHIYPVSTLVNSPDNDSPECVERVSPASSPPFDPGEQLKLGFDE